MCIRDSYATAAIRSSPLVSLYCNADIRLLGLSYSLDVISWYWINFKDECVANSCEPHVVHWEQAGICAYLAFHIHWSTYLGMFNHYYVPITITFGMYIRLCHLKYHLDYLENHPTVWELGSSSVTVEYKDHVPSLILTDRRHQTEWKRVFAQNVSYLWGVAEDSECIHCWVICRLAGTFFGEHQGLKGSMEIV